jgi:6-phosphogluconolactonase/glucosamine-6-phosphate isomerase/deaminase
MGEDGHVASLFPGKRGGGFGIRLCRGGWPQAAQPAAITLTYPVLAVARETWVLVSGNGKELALRNSLQGKAPPRSTG